MSILIKGVDEIVKNKRNGGVNYENIKQMRI